MSTEQGTGQGTGRHFDTRAIHAGQAFDPTTGAIIPPIYQTSTFVQDGIGGFRGGYEYNRAGNPTRSALEAQLAALEGGAHARSFASAWLLSVAEAALSAVAKSAETSRTGLGRLSAN